MLNSRPANELVSAAPMAEKWEVLAGWQQFPGAFEGLPADVCHTRSGASGDVCGREANKMFPCNRGYIPEAGCEVTGVAWCWEHSVWVYRCAQATVPIDSRTHSFVFQALRRIEQARAVRGAAETVRPKRPALAQQDFFLGWR